MKPKVKLHGHHNQCPGCAELFNSIGAFDRHRVGRFGVDRRCLSETEMCARGMTRNAAEFWITAVLPERVTRVYETA